MTKEFTTLTGHTQAETSHLSKILTRTVCCNPQALLKPMTLTANPFGTILLIQQTKKVGLSFQGFGRTNSDISDILSSEQKIYVEEN